MISLVAATNFFVDPESIYNKRSSLSRNVESYVEALSRSPYGMVYESGERAIKRRLANISNAECFVVGSSRSMQISLRENSWISEQCDSLANLGVSGAGIEDIISYLWLLKERSGKTIIVSIDPWLFEFGTDIRWTENRDLYASAMGDLYDELAPTPLINSGWTKLRNLINKDYFLSSIRQVREVGFFNSLAPAMENIHEATSETMQEENTILTDGSLSYSHNNIARLSERDIRGLDEKSTHATVDPHAVLTVKNIVSMLQGAGNEFVFVLSPMHPGAFPHLSDNTLQNLIDVTNEARLISEATDSQLIGSFFSQEVGCSSSDFYDAIHPRLSCIKRVTSQQSSP